MKLDLPKSRPCFFVGSSKKDLSDLPLPVRQSVGYALHEAQLGDEPLDAKALKGFGGRSILEIVKDFDSDTYRAIYTVRFAEALYVLHVFQKKSKKGAETPKHVMDLVKQRLREAETHYREHFEPRRAQKMTVTSEKPSSIEEGSGNIFADLDLPDAEETLLKAQVVVVLHRLLKARNLTQTAAAKLLNVSQPDLSRILRGDFRGWSVERLMRMLTSFEQDIEIVVRPHPRSGEAGRITVSAEPV